MKLTHMKTTDIKDSLYDIFLMSFTLAIILKPRNPKPEFTFFSPKVIKLQITRLGLE